MDCTACVGGHSHLASSQTKVVRQALNDLPAIGTSLVLLVVDKMKQSRVCYDGIGSVGSHLKAVNLVLLVIS